MDDDLSHFVQRSRISNAAQAIANDNQFVIESYRVHSGTNSDSKIIKIGSIQSSINSSATASVDEIRTSVFGKVEKIIVAAAIENVNILCLPEMWYMPYPFYTPDNLAWKDFAEDAESGASTHLIKKVWNFELNSLYRQTIGKYSGSRRYHNDQYPLSPMYQLAAKFEMIIVSSILEKESGMFFNTTLIISTTGNVIGKYRKIHIPPIEQPYLQPGAFENLVLDTEVGKIGILICYERHFPLCWMMRGLHQADIVFNPSAEDKNSMSERLWFAEGINAAVSNGFFTVMVNRTGTETCGDGKSYSYFGSNYVASPYGFATPQLSGETEGLLITEIDLNDCRKVKKEFSIHANDHLDLYINKLCQLRLN